MSDPLSFERFSSFVHALGKLDPQADPSSIFQKYIAAFPNPLPTDTGVVLFRLLFPHFTIRRRYQMKEKTLAGAIAKVMTLSGAHEEILKAWDDDGKVGHGASLGDEARKVAELRSSGRGSTSDSRISLADIDRLLDELACHSSFSDLGTDRPLKPRSREIILRTIYTSNLSPQALNCITQIILQDLRPITCPLPTGTHHPAIALQLSATCRPPPVLDVHTAMKVWDWEMRDLYRVTGDLDMVCRTVERMGGGAGRRRPGDRVRGGPVLGVNVEIPKCEKGRSIESALKMIAGPQGRKTKEIWAETKYDGERMQIHVWLHHGRPCVKIYSKSKRDSTEDRRETHNIILGSIGLPVTHNPHHLLSKRLETVPAGPEVTSVILEAEMLPYNESDRQGGHGPGIEEFWHLTSLSSRGGQSRDKSRHLFLSYFDILHYNGRSLLHESYQARRTILESVIRSIPGFCQLAERTHIDVTQGMACAASQLATAFKSSNTRIEEGLVLKAAESKYNDPYLRWVKLKRDYIPGVGDCVDMAILAIGWDKDRARELRVGPSVMTTLYAGVLTNKTQVARRQQDPHFEILFRTSYGMSKAQLAELNNALGRPPYQTRKYGVAECQGLSYRFTMRADMPNPCAMFTQPLNGEIVGAGFQKIPLSKHYELRWPRMQKLYRPVERPWVDALDGDEYLETCLKALGHLLLSAPAPTSPEGDSIARLFRTYSTGGLDFPDLWSPDKSIKRESISPRLSLPRTPIRRSRSMITSPYTYSPATRDSRMRSTIARPLLSSISALEERLASVQMKTSPVVLPTPQRTPILRVKRRKRPPPSPRTPVLKETSKTNTPSPLHHCKSPDTLKENPHTIAGSSTCMIANSMGQLMISPAATRLILVDGRDAAKVAKLRDDALRLKREQNQHAPIRIVDSHLMDSQTDLDIANNRYTICII